jgi:hypothetical protein
MSEFNTKNQKQNKSSSQSKSANDIISLGTMEYKDSRASNENLIKLQAGAEAQTNGGLLGCNKFKADSYTSGSRVAQLQAKSNASKAPNDSEVIQRVIISPEILKFMAGTKLGINQKAPDFLNHNLYSAPPANAPWGNAIKKTDDVSGQFQESNGDQSISALNRKTISSQGNKYFSQINENEVALAKLSHTPDETSFTSMNYSNSITDQQRYRDGETTVRKASANFSAPQVTLTHSDSENSLGFKTGEASGSVSTTSTSHGNRIHSTYGAEGKLSGPSVEYSKEKGASSSLGGFELNAGGSWAHNVSEDPDKPDLKQLAHFKIGNKGIDASVSPENIGNAVQATHPEAVKKVSNYVSNPISDLASGGDLYPDNPTPAETHSQIQPPTPTATPTHSPTETLIPNQSPSPTPSPVPATPANPVANVSPRGILGRGISALKSGLQPTIPLAKNPLFGRFLNSSKAPIKPGIPWENLKKK